MSLGTKASAFVPFLFLSRNTAALFYLPFFSLYSKFHTHSFNTNKEEFE